MRFPVLTAAVLLAAAPAAFAFQEPAPAPAPAPKTEEPAPAPVSAPATAAPAKRENKISPEARALLDGYQKVVYSPIALGLKDLKGTLIMKLQIPGMDESAMEGMPDMAVKFVIVFTAPKSLTIEASTEHPMLMAMVDQLKMGVEQVVLQGMGLLEPAQAEFDMEVATEAGAKVLVIKTYDKGAPQGEVRLVINAEGLATKGSMKMTDPNSGMEFTLDLTLGYVKEGDRYRIESQSMSLPTMPEPLESKFTYTEADGIKILTGIDTKTPQATLSYKYTELSVNGKKVALAEAKAEAAPAAAPTAPTDPSKSDPAPAPAEKKPE